MKIHIHTEECYLREHAGAVYTPCRADGLDRNLRHLHRVDFETLLRVHNDGSAIRGLTLVCDAQNL